MLQGTNINGTIIFKYIIKHYPCRNYSVFRAVWFFINLGKTRTSPEMSCFCSECCLKYIQQTFCSY